MEQFIKIPRSFYEIFRKNPNAFFLYSYLSFNADWEDAEVNGVKVRKGTLVTSIRQLAKETELSIQNIRTALCLTRVQHIINTRVITRGNTQATVISVYNYESWVRLKKLANTPSNTPSNTGLTQTQHSFKKFPPTPPYKEYIQDNTYTKIIPNGIRESGEVSVFENLIEEKTAVAGTNPQPPAPSPNEQKFSPEDVVKIWNEKTVSVAKVAKLPESRKAKIILRLKEFGKTDEEKRKTLEDICEKIKTSDFLSGRNGQWKATFDWIFDNDKNWLKVLEGNYENKGTSYHETDKRKYYDKRRGVDSEATSVEDYKAGF